MDKIGWTEINNVMTSSCCGNNKFGKVMKRDNKYEFYSIRAKNSGSIQKLTCEIYDQLFSQLMKNNK
jgi:hypothetical protein